MNKNEWQFKNMVRGLKIDDEPNKTHRSNLRRDMLAEFDSPGQPAIESAGFITGLHRLRPWHVAALASAAIIIIAVLISSGVFTGLEHQPDRPIVQHPDSQTPESPQVGNNLAQPAYPEKPSPDSPGDASLAMRAELEEIDRLYAAGDIGGLIAMLDSSSRPAKVRAAQLLAKIGDLSAIESLARLSSTLGADMPNDPFAAAIEAIKERLGWEGETVTIVNEAAGETQIPPETDALQLEADKDNEQPGIFGLKVINAKTNQPIEGAELAIQIMAWQTSSAANGTRNVPKRSSTTKSIKAATNTFGRYNIGNGENDIISFVVRIKKDAFVPKRIWYRPEGSGIEIPKNYTLKLEPGTIVGGFVRKKDDNTPIADATVKVSVHRQGEGIEIIDIRDIPCQTDAEGRWQCDVIPEKVFEVYAWPEHPDYVSTEKYSTNLSMQALRAGQAVLYMRSGLNVTGTVFTLDGDPIKGATIYQGESRYSIEPKTKTDSDGRFRFEKCKPGEMILTVKAKGFAQDMKVINVNNQLEDVRFDLGSGNSVTVRIVDVDGSGIRGVQIVADEWRQRPYPHNYSRRNIRISGRTNADGYATLTDLPEDEILYDMYKKDYASTDGYPITPREEGYVIQLLRSAKLTGTVTDAETGQPIDTFRMIYGIDSYGRNSPTWQDHNGKTVKGGKYELALGRQSDGLAVKIEAEGYLPAESPIFYSEGKDATYDFQLVRGEGVKGVVFLSDGKPAGGVDVVVATQAHFVDVKGTAFRRDSTQYTVTDAKGRFALPQQTADYKLLAIGEAGTAEIDGSDFEATGEITLQEFGRVEGTVYIGSAPAAGREVYLNCNYGGSTSQMIRYDNRVVTDDEGKFVFDKVRPGKVAVSRVTIRPDGGRSYPHGTPLEVLPGKTVRIDIGGGGRKVVGRLTAPTGISGTVNFTQGSFKISRHISLVDIPFPQIGFPDNIFSMTEEEKQTWQQEWAQSPQGKEFMATIQEVMAKQGTGYSIAAAADGSFEVEDVLTGNCILTGNLYDPSSQGRRGPDNIIGTVRHEFTVPELKDDSDDKPFDAGRIRLKAPTRIEPGEFAPDFPYDELDGPSARLRGLRGKFVLLDMGGFLMSGYLDRLPHLKEAYAAFVPQGRLEILTVFGGSVNKWEGILRPLRIFIADQDITWKVALAEPAHMGENPKLFADYGSHAHNSLMLVGPDGKIVKTRIEPEELMDVLTAEIPRESVE